MIAYLRRLLDAHRGRRIAIQEVFALRGLLELEREKVQQYRKANALMAAAMERERSMLNDQWAAYERVEADRDFWKSEALKAGAEIVHLRAALDCPLIVTPAPLRLVEGAKR